MKFSYLSLYLLFFIFPNCGSTQSQNLNKLDIKEKEVYNVLQSFIEEQEEYADLEKSTILINIEKAKKGVELRIGLLYKEILSAYLIEKKDNVIGFFKYEGITVIVFGKKNNPLFEKTNIKKPIPFFYVKPEAKTKKGEIPPPPVIYEPIVWIYTYYKGDLKLKDKGRFTLIN